MTVIGGADGPTAIYVASVTFWPYIIGAIAVIAGVVLFLVLRRKNKK